MIVRQWLSIRKQRSGNHAYWFSKVAVGLVWRSLLWETQSKNTMQVLLQYSQLSISSVQFCSSRGYLLKSIMHAAVVVILIKKKTETEERLRWYHKDMEREEHRQFYVFYSHKWRKSLTERSWFVTDTHDTIWWTTSVSTTYWRCTLKVIISWLFVENMKVPQQFNNPWLALKLLLLGRHFSDTAWILVGLNVCSVLMFLNLLNLLRLMGAGVCVHVAAVQRELTITLFH